MARVCHMWVEIYLSYRFQGLPAGCVVPIRSKAREQRRGGRIGQRANHCIQCWLSGKAKLPSLSGLTFDLEALIWVSCGVQFCTLAISGLEQLVIPVLYLIGETHLKQTSGLKQNLATRPCDGTLRHNTESIHRIDTQNCPSSGLREKSARCRGIWNLSIAWWLLGSRPQEKYR